MPCYLPGRLVFFCLALVTAPGVQALRVENYPALRSFSQELADGHGFSTDKLRRVFRCVKLQPEIVEAMERPKELRPWHEYKKIFLTEENVTRGASFWKKHDKTLSAAQQRYGVAPEIIVAIIGVETQYGRNSGNHSILDALTTLMLDYPPRAAYFRAELIEFLLLTRELDIDPCRTKGSYAGAMGLAQFMPSSYRRYAVDFNDDGKRDILSNAEDAIGSVANFLSEHGWETGAPIIEEVYLEGTRYFWIEQLGLKPALPARQLIRFGIFPRHLERSERRAALIALEGDYGPFHRLGYNNFYVITRYNHSKRYAMAIYELSELIRQRMEEKPPS